MDASYRLVRKFEHLWTNGNGGSSKGSGEAIITVTEVDTMTPGVCLVVGSLDAWGPLICHQLLAPAFLTAGFFDDVSFHSLMSALESSFSL